MLALCQGGGGIVKRGENETAAESQKGNNGCHYNNMVILPIQGQSETDAEIAITGFFRHRHFYIVDAGVVAGNLFRG